MHVLIVGTSVVDLFLDIDHDHVKIEDRKVTFTLGDKVPSSIKKSALGGNGANVSAGLTRLEIPVTFYTYLGNDFFSREIQTGFSNEGVEIEAEKKKNTTPPLPIFWVPPPKVGFFWGRKTKICGGGEFCFFFFFSLILSPFF